MSSLLYRTYVCEVCKYKEQRLTGDFEFITCPKCDRSFLTRTAVMGIDWAKKETK